VTVIVNTTVLSNFAFVERLDLLESLLGVVYIATDVYAEILDGLAEGYAFYDAVEHEIQAPSGEPWLLLTAPTDEELRLFTALLGALHQGEAACLAIAATRGWAFLTDDRRARRAARRLNTLVSGTLGVLVEAIKSDLIGIDQANALLAKMMKAGYYSPYDNLAELL